MGNQGGLSTLESVGAKQSKISTVWFSNLYTLLMRYGVKFISYHIKSVYKSLDQTVVFFFFIPKYQIVFNSWNNESQQYSSGLALLTYAQQLTASALY